MNLLRFLLTALAGFAFGAALTVASAHARCGRERQA